MGKILPDRVLEPAFFLKNDLRPLCFVGVAKNPARKVLGFNDENTRHRHENMINLCGATLGAQSDVIDEDMREVKIGVNLIGDQRLTDIGLKALKGLRFADANA